MDYYAHIDHIGDSPDGETGRYCVRVTEFVGGQNGAEVLRFEMGWSSTSRRSLRRTAEIQMALKIVEAGLAG